MPVSTRAGDDARRLTTSVEMEPVHVREIVGAGIREEDIRKVARGWHAGSLLSIPSLSRVRPSTRQRGAATNPQRLQ
jgi:hypothetical protein